MHVVHPGINLKGHGGHASSRDRPPYTVGYFARICPEKGFHNLVEAFVSCGRCPDAPACRLRVSGWLGENNRPFFDEQMAKLQDAGLAATSSTSNARPTRTRCGSCNRSTCCRSRRRTASRRGSYVLEALANGVPVVQPRHGSFPELIEADRRRAAGRARRPGRAGRRAAAGCWRMSRLRRRLGEDGRKAVHARFTAEHMARETAAVLAPYHHRHTPASAEAVPS